MAEALISRLGGDGADISNETKQSLGLSNNASLDDVLLMLSLRDSNYATILVSVKDDYGKPVSGANVQMQELGGNTISYTTNEAGQCLFKTNAGSANVVEVHNFVDILNGQSIKVDCPVGSVSSVNLNRVRRNNREMVTIGSNRNIVFSNSLNNVEVTCVGAGGIAGLPYCDIGVYVRRSGWSLNTNIQRFTGGGGNGYANTRTISVNYGQQYQCIVGKTGQNKQITGSDWAKWGRTASFDYAGTTGISGGTTSFGGVISAVGGSGGQANGVNGTGAGSVAISGYGAGSNSARVSISSGGQNASNESSCMYFYVYANNTSTGNGLIRLSNFNYK